MRKRTLPSSLRRNLPLALSRKQRLRRYRAFSSEGCSRNHNKLQRKQIVGYQSAPDAEHKKTLLLKDFTPRPMLHAPAHSIDRAKYYVIDVHNHVNDAARIEEHLAPERVIQVMDNTNVKTV